MMIEWIIEAHGKGKRRPIKERVIVERVVVVWIVIEVRKISSVVVRTRIVVVVFVIFVLFVVFFLLVIFVFVLIRPAVALDDCQFRVAPGQAEQHKTEKEQARRKGMHASDVFRRL